MPNRKAAEVRPRGTLSSKQWAAARDPLSLELVKVYLVSCCGRAGKKCRIVDCWTNGFW